MIRPVTPEDTRTLLRLTAQTGSFKPMEINALFEVLEEYHEETIEEGHQALLLEVDGQVWGYVYYAPEEMTADTWYLWWIAVDVTVQNRGIGAKLLKWVEDDVRDRGGRVLFIETSSLPHYESTQRFYLKKGYDQVACMPDFYDDGDDMIIYRKRIAGAAKPQAAIVQVS